MKASILNTAALFAAAASAAPALLFRQVELEGNKIWSSDDGGNVEVEIGDGRTSFGSTPPKSTLQAIRDGCKGLGCTPNKEYPTTTTYATGPHVDEKEMVMVVEGLFGTHGQKGDLNQLLMITEKVFESLHAENVTKSEMVDYLEGTCPPGKLAGGCPGQTKESIEQWSTTDHIIVKVSDDEGKTAGWINMVWSIKDIEKNSGLCEGLSSVGGALAGAIPGIGTAVGAGLALGGLLCKE